MITNQPRLIQLLWLMVAGALLTTAGLLQKPLDDKSVQYDLAAKDDPSSFTHPEVRLLTLAPGGLRAPVVNWLWIRSEMLKNEGQYYESLQLTELVCKLQPHIPSVWSFQAWNMAWNISSGTHTPEERWQWVMASIKLLRDDGLPLNPKSLLLYRDIGWIYFQKIADPMDDMHRVYKQRWALEMQRLLAAPPMGSTQDSIENFRPIAKIVDEGLVDLDPRRRGRKTEIQADRQARLLAEEPVAQYARLLEPLGVTLGWTLLDAYNSFSEDDAAMMVRAVMPQIANDRDRALAKLINDPTHKAARDRMLAFARAQLLWNSYGMDATWMFSLMEQLQAPFDWRLPEPHGYYWVSYGIHVCDSLNDANVDTLNADRVLLNSMKELTWNGRLFYMDNPDDPLAPTMLQWADMRYTKPTIEAFERMLQAVQGKMVNELNRKADPTFEAAHQNFTINAIEMFYAMGRRDHATSLWRYLQTRYPDPGNTPDWGEDVEEFVTRRMNEGGIPTFDQTRAFMTASIVAGYTNLAIGKNDLYNYHINFGRWVYELFQKDAPRRLELPPFEFFQANIISDLLMRPEMHAVSLDLVARSRLYKSLENQLQILMYDQLNDLMRPAVEQEGMDFDAMFPKPMGFDQWRQSQMMQQEMPK